MALLDLLVGPVLDIVNKIIPTPMTAEQKVQAQIQLLQLQQSSEGQQLNAQLQATAQQTDTNKIEAANTNIFVAGWRPFVGWVCGGGLAYQYLVNPLFSWFALIVHWPTPPALDLQTLVTMLGGLLGFGYMRSVDKKNGVANGN
jgi:Holin of 3TMs, for gene-transfer release